MNFRTELHIAPADFKISMASRILTMGSCFADVMGARMQDNKFAVKINPFGVIYNPVSMQKLIQAAITEKELSEDLFWQHQGLWYHYDLHSEIAAASAPELTDTTTKLIHDVTQFLASADVVLLTLGTAFIYRLKETGSIVANCHKAPASLFSKELLPVAEVTDSVVSLYRALIAIRPQLQVILTLSPVRHIKDGIPENQVSKSVLRVACHEAALQCQQLSYFPAYECMLDDLRDYRFYKKDMIHPSDVAEQYIWEKFVAAYMDEEAKAFLKEWESIRKALAHKPFHPRSEAHQAFLRKTREKILYVRRYVNLEHELQLLDKEIGLQP
jgi:hypothetical protein